MKKVLVIALLVTMSVLAPTFSRAQTATPFTEETIQVIVTELEKQAANLKTKTDTPFTTETLQIIVAELEKNVPLLKIRTEPASPIGSLQAIVTALQGRVTALQGQIETLEGELKVARAEEKKAQEELKATKQTLIFEGVLRHGVRSEEVKTLQKFLAQFSDIYPEKLITGYFGPLTEAAVKRFQEKNNIVSGGTVETTGFGQVGPLTTEKLNEVAATIQQEVTLSTETTTAPTTITEDGLTAPTTSTVSVSTATTTTTSGGGGEGSATVVASSQTTQPAPEPAPEPVTAVAGSPVISNIQATNITQSSATITWTTNESADSKLLFSQNTSFPATFSTTTINSTLTTSHSIPITGVSPSAVVYYTVSSKDGDGNTTTSMTQTFTTAAPPPPAEGSSFGPWITYLSITPTIGASGMIVTFTATAEDQDGVVNVGVSFSYPKPVSSLRDGLGFSLNSAINGTGSESKPIDQSRIPTVLGEYVVSVVDARDSLGNISRYYSDGTVIGAKQNMHNLTIPPIIYIGVTPAPIISNVQASNITETSATITWTTNSPADSNVNNGTSPGLIDAVLISDTSAYTTGHSMTLGGLSAGTTYYYTASSKPVSGKTTTSAIQSFTTFPDATPPVISNLNATITKTMGKYSAAIAWTTNESANTTVKYSSVTPITQPVTISDGGLTTSHSVTIGDLKSTETVYYKISSADSRGNTTESSEYFFVTQ